MRKSTRDTLAIARVEKDVESAYRAEIKHFRPDADIDSPFHTDGFARWGETRLLLEAKYDLNLKDRVTACTVIGQSILYLKQFETAGEPLPNALMVADRNECFVLPVAAVSSFLSLPIDWSASPSAGSPELTRALVEGLNLLPYVYDVNKSLDFNAVLEKCEALAKGEQHHVRATVGNLATVFAYWVERVFKDAKLKSTEQVDVFLRCLFQPKDVYLHPGKKGVLVVPGYADVVINSEQYRSFFDHFQQGYKPSEIERFYGMKDRLVEDDARRRQGAFFTPKLWVDEAHREIEKVLGPNWRDECIVWDNSCGTGNLTRDYKFADLILSTAEAADIAVINEQGWNAGALVFQYDFLNRDAESPFFPAGVKSVLPAAVEAKLKAAAEAGKKLVFFMNPPYGTANDAGAKGTSKEGIALTATNKAMKEEELGACSQQLYAQFMFESALIANEYGFKNYTVASFSMPKFMCSGSYKKFRDWWYDLFAFQSGFLFQASHFADVSGRWGISFTVWSEGKTDSTTDIPVAVKDVEDFNVVSKSTKPVYNSDGREASEWVRVPIKGLRGEDAPQMSSGLKVKEGPGCRGVAAVGQLLYMTSVANCLYKSGTDVFFTSSCSSMAHGLSVLPANFRRAVALYAARKLVADNWVIHEDEYLKPDESAEGYSQWVDDCHVFTLLDTKNNCTAMRDVLYKTKLWRIKNNWFWRTRASALALYDNEATPELYKDAKAEVEDSYFATQIPKLDFSPEAITVLAKLDDLLVKSLSVRESYAAGKPELHLLAHDAGLYQLKFLWRELYSTEWAELQASFHALADKLRPGVYKYGFLKKVK